MQAKALFEELIVAGTNAIAMPLRNDPESMEDLHQRLTVEFNKPAPDRRLLNDEDRLLASVLTMHARALRSREETRAATLAQVIGVLLPKARENYGRALEAMRSPVREDAYGGLSR